MHPPACIGRDETWGELVMVCLCDCSSACVMYSLRPVLDLRSILAQPYALYLVTLFSTHQASRCYSLAFWLHFTWASLAGDWFPSRFQKSCSLARWLFLAPPKKKMSLFFFIYPPSIHFYLPYCLPVIVLRSPQQVRGKASILGSTASLQPQFLKICFLY